MVLEIILFMVIVVVILHSFYAGALGAAQSDEMSHNPFVLIGVLLIATMASIAIYMSVAILCRRFNV
jgi:hypothetical protein